jgi:large subunit ribosomal protein L13
MAKTYTIDATDKVLGRLATEAAFILQGKKSPDYAPNKVGSDKVIIFNISKIMLTGKKLEDKNYRSYSGYPGGVKTVFLKEMIEKDPTEPLKRAIYDMLPKNKLRSRFMENLKLYADEIKETRR